MRLFLIVGIGLLAAQASAAAKPAEGKLDPPKAECKKTTAQFARRGIPARPQTLNELPPANAYAAMVRTVNGCEVPLILTRVPRSR